MFDWTVKEVLVLFIVGIKLRVKQVTDKNLFFRICTCAIFWSSGGWKEVSEGWTWGLKSEGKCSGW